MLYDKSVRDASAPLYRCIGFIECTKIKKERFKGDVSLHRAHYYGERRINCLIYQTITKQDGIILSLYDSEVERRYDMMLLCNRGFEQRQQKILFIYEQQYYNNDYAAYVRRTCIQM